MVESNNFTYKNKQENSIFLEPHKRPYKYWKIWNKINLINDYKKKV